MSDSLDTIVIKREYDAPRELVYRIITDPEMIPRWHSPSEDITIEILAFELKVGGQFRLRYSGHEEGLGEMEGEYRELRPPERVQYTWRWVPPSQFAGHESLVTIDLVDKNDRTELTLTHERFPSSDVADRYRNGWPGSLDRLGTLITSR